MHAGTYAHIHMEIHTRVHVGTHACIHVGTHATFVCMSAHTSVWVHTSLLYIDIFVGIHLDMYTSTRFGITCRVYVWLFRSLTLVCLVPSSVRLSNQAALPCPLYRAQRMRMCAFTLPHNTEHTYTRAPR